MSYRQKQHTTSPGSQRKPFRGRNKKQLTPAPPPLPKPQSRVRSEMGSLRTAIEKARDEKLLELNAFLEKLLCKWGLRRPNIEQIQQAGKKGVQLARDWNALVAVSCSDPGPLTPDRALHVIERMQNANCPQDWVDGIFRTVGRRIGRGRPRTLQPIGLKALELHRSDPARWTWKALRGLCNCGRVEHDFLCQKKIQREALLLEGRLKSLGVHLPWNVNPSPKK